MTALWLPSDCVYSKRIYEFRTNALLCHGRLTSLQAPAGEALVPSGFLQSSPQSLLWSLPFGSAP